MKSGNIGNYGSNGERRDIFVALRTKVTILNQKINCSIMKDYWNLANGTNRLSQDVGNQQTVTSQKIKGLNYRMAQD